MAYQSLNPAAGNPLSLVVLGIDLVPSHGEFIGCRLEEGFGVVPVLLVSGLQPSDT
jgi:hypothetical protein